MSDRDPTTWTILLCLRRCMSRKLDQNWRSWDFIIHSGIIWDASFSYNGLIHYATIPTYFINVLKNCNEKLILKTTNDYVFNFSHKTIFLFKMFIYIFEELRQKEGETSSLDSLPRCLQNSAMWYMGIRLPRQGTWIPGQGTNDFSDLSISQRLP